VQFTIHNVLSLDSRDATKFSLKPLLSLSFSNVVTYSFAVPDVVVLIGVKCKQLIFNKFCNLLPFLRHAVTVLVAMSDRSRSSPFGDSEALLYDISPKLVRIETFWNACLYSLFALVIRRTVLRVPRYFRYSQDSS